MLYSVMSLTRKRYFRTVVPLLISYLLNLFGLTFDIVETNSSEFSGIVFGRWIHFSLSQCYVLRVIVAMEVIS